MLQGNLTEEGLTDVSIIKSINGYIEYYTENNGKIWAVEDDISLISNKENNKML